MSDSIKIAVDGDDGVTLSRNPGVRLVTPDAELALERYGLSENRDGAHGRNAVPAIPGGPAGFLAVELSESNTIPEGIQIRVLRSDARQRPPSLVEVPARRDVLLTAIGGNGEVGHTGDDGQTGMDGVAGERATRETDATRGTNGGNGGDAGQGTDGGDGGDGGTIEIYVDEDDTHLLFAVDWDVRGGSGGTPGNHGKSGEAGCGGAGGKGHKWEELIGHKYVCTSRCIGQNETSASTSLVRAGSRMGTGALALAAPLGQQMVQGGNLQRVIAQAALQYGAMRQQRNNTGNCKCAGGPADISCVGCEPIPIHKTFKRAVALNGRDGRPGNRQTDALSLGWTGQPGSAAIIVRMRDGSQQRFELKYNLELVDFDIEDENGDGVFEPGEHAYVRRIRVRNNGGMPSPKCRIPITVATSDWLLPIPAPEGQAFIPSSLAAGETVALTDAVKVLIRQNEDPPQLGGQFLQHDVLSIRAHMPWLNRALPGFDFTMTVEFQYPIEIRAFDFLTSLAQGSTNRFTFELYNKSAKALGSETSSSRSVEVMVACFTDGVVMLSPTNDWDSMVTRDVQLVDPTSATSMSQAIRIQQGAECFQHVDIEIGLYIANPIQRDAEFEGGQVSKSLIQRMSLRIQIASHHEHRADSAFLLVTNSESTRPNVHAIMNFVRDDLKMKMDEWNVSLYGGLQYPAEEHGPSPTDVTTVYQGKSIVFLGNKFDFFTKGSRDVADFCDLRALAAISNRDTPCLFLGSLGGRNFKDLLRRCVFPIPCTTQTLSDHINQSNIFLSKKELIGSFQQSKLISAPDIQIYKTPIKSRWYRLGGANPSSEAKKLARYLRHQLPQERFLVSSVDDASSEGGGADIARAENGSKVRKQLKDLAILRGCSQQALLLATEPQVMSTTGAPADNLHAFEKYMLVQTLPMTKRVGILWTYSANNELDTGNQCSTHAFDCIILSLLVRVDFEIQILLSTAGWLDGAPCPKMIEDRMNFLRIHLPTLAEIVRHPQASTPGNPPDHVLEILKYAESSCRPQKYRHIAQASLMPRLSRRSQLRRCLASVFDAFLRRKSCTDNEIANFHSAARLLHSRFDSTKRETSKTILKRVSELTQKSEHQFTQGHSMASRMIPKTVACTAEEWRGRWQEIETAKARLAEDVKFARNKLGRMVSDAPRIADADS